MCFHWAESLFSLFWCKTKFFNKDQNTSSHVLPFRLYLIYSSSSSHGFSLFIRADKYLMLLPFRYVWWSFRGIWSSLTQIKLSSVNRQSGLTEARDHSGWVSLTALAIKHTMETETCRLCLLPSPRWMRITQILRHVADKDITVLPSDSCGWYECKAADSEGCVL